MRRRCSLCGGKLNGNICTECGLDNSKNDDQYVTLGNSGHEESLTHIHTEAEKPYEGKTMTRENVRKAKNADKNAKKAAAKKASKNAAAGKVNPAGNGYSAANASYNTAGTSYSQTGNQSYSYTSSSMRQSSRPVKKKRKLGKFLIGFVIIAAFAGELGGTISDEVQHYFDEYTYDDSDSYTEEDPYSDLQEVMPEEGELTKLRASMVCEKALAFCARDLELGSYLLLGKGEDATGGRFRESITSDALEALIGAIYLDGGFANAKEFILKYILNDLEGKRLFYDSKTILQEMVQGGQEKGIVYQLVGEEGPDHNKSFRVEVVIGGEAFGCGIGRTKKAAEQEAAYQAILKLKEGKVQ